MFGTAPVSFQVEIMIGESWEKRILTFAATNPSVVEVFTPSDSENPYDTIDFRTGSFANEEIAM